MNLSNINSENFEAKALAIFAMQARENRVYKEYLDILQIKIPAIHKLKDIPFLPIEFFKTKEVICGDSEPTVIFTSSGTTGSHTSRHLVVDNQLYINSFKSGFDLFYGDVSNYCILGLLPSYIEQGASSLVYMVDELIKSSKHPKSGFYLHNYEALSEELQRLKSKGQKVILFGVTYALLDMAEQFPQIFEDLIIIETGGMKGRRKEIIRNELHDKLKKGFGTANIHSEYGMTELLSQAYSQENGLFFCPPWMKISIGDIHDPTSEVENGKTGRIKVIDLANRYSCSFLATSDLGQLFDDGSFSVLGRMDGSDVRGCNLLI